jgi:hypothetical protein
MPNFDFHVKQQPASGSTGLGGGTHLVGTIWTPRADSNADYLKVAYSGLSEHGYRNVAPLINKTSAVSPVFIPRGSNKPIFNQTVKKWSHYDSSLELGVRTGGNAGWFASEDPTSSTDRDLQAFGSANYTLETWVYIPTFASSANPSVDDPTLSIFHHTTGPVGSGNDKGFKLLITGTNFLNDPDKGLYFTAPPEGTCTAYTSSNHLTTNTWHHIAAVRNGNGNSNFKLYIDGINRTSIYAGTVNQTWDYTGPIFCTAPVDTDSGSGNFTAWNTTKIQDYRVYQGVAKYTSNFNTSLPDSMFIKN